MEAIQYVNALRASEKEINAISEILERRDAGSGNRNRRASPRFPYYAATGLRLTVNPEGNYSNHLLVWPRNISAGGMGFLHGSLLYRGTPCSIVLVALDRELIYATGHIVRCDHVCGRFHDLGLRFNKPVDVSNFLDHTTLNSVSNERAEPLTQAVGHEKLYAYTVALSELIEHRAPQEALLQQIDCLMDAVRQHVKTNGESVDEGGAIESPAL